MSTSSKLFLSYLRMSVFVLTFFPMAVSYFCKLPQNFYSINILLAFLVSLLGLGASSNTPASDRLLTSHLKPCPHRNQAIRTLDTGHSTRVILGLALDSSLTQ